MVGGFNTNVRYKGRTFHVQTEDSGPNVAKIVTLLYEGGTILLSRKTSYGSDPAKVSREAVRGLMEQQHREMVEALKAGSLEGEIGKADAATEPPTPPSARAPAGSPPAVRESRAARVEPAPGRSDAGPARDFGHGVITQTPLDEVVLAHLAAK